MGETATIDPLLRLGEVLAATGLGRSAIYRRMEAGTFPRPKDLGGGVVRWPRSAVLAWLEALPDSVPAPPPPAGEVVAAELPSRRRGRPRRPRAA